MIVRTRTDRTNAVLRTNAALRVRVDELLDLEGVAKEIQRNGRPAGLASLASLAGVEPDLDPIATNAALRARIARAFDGDEEPKEAA